jgi:hypothetical protein
MQVGFEGQMHITLQHTTAKHAENSPAAKWLVVLNLLHVWAHGKSTLAVHNPACWMLKRMRRDQHK